MARYAHVPEPTPMGSINVTPFIDVMLVLLIVMILSIPPMTHKVPVDLPTPPVDGSQIETPHKLVIERNGTLLWDGAVVTDAALPNLLAGLKADPKGVLQLQSDPESRYERFDQVLALVKRANVTRLGFVGNERMVDF